MDFHDMDFGNKIFAIMILLSCLLVVGVAGALIGKAKCSPVQNTKISVSEGIHGQESGTASKDASSALDT